MWLGQCLCRNFLFRLRSEVRTSWQNSIQGVNDKNAALESIWKGNREHKGNKAIVVLLSSPQSPFLWISFFLQGLRDSENVGSNA